MSNTTNDEDGMVIIGIANNEDSYREWREVYSDAAVMIKQHCVVGIEREAVSLCDDVDKYLALLRKKLSAEPISEPLKSFVLGNFREYDFNDRKVICLWSKHFDGLSTYDGKVYKREGNESVLQKSYK